MMRMSEGKSINPGVSTYKNKEYFYSCMWMRMNGEEGRRRRTRRRDYIDIQR
jgi:hypothetical protein